MLLDGGMKFKAIFFGIIKSSKLPETIIAVVVKTRVDRYLVTPGYKLCIQIIQFGLVLQSSFIDLPVDLLTKITVMPFKKFSSLLQRILFTVNLNHHLAGYYTI